MPYHTDDTICAIATAPGGAARGMIRVSGAGVETVAATLFEADTHHSIAGICRSTALDGHVRVDLNPRDEPLSRVTASANERRGSRRLPATLYLWPTARSYTREPVAEFHTVGSPPLLEALLASICRCGARLAEPGEFTLRAFLAGRLDLTQAEAVLGVIDAHGESELRGALDQLAGGIARPLHQLREDLLQLLAELEAGLDFVEEDIEFVSSEVAQQRLDSAQIVLDDVARQLASRHTANSATHIALTGAPNAGKSSLFNALIARYRITADSKHTRSTPALVSPQRGTTRDYLSAELDLDGLICELVDTAGVDPIGLLQDEDGSPARDRQAAAIELRAQAIAVQRGKRAALRAYCIDSTRLDSVDPSNHADCDIIVWTKAELASCSSRIVEPNGLPVVVTSSRTNEGLDAFCAALRKLLTNESRAQHGQVVTTTADRCRESIRQASESLARSANILNAGGGDELVAAELRTALSELGKVVGTVYTDDVLDRIFSSFCIGK